MQYRLAFSFGGSNPSLSAQLPLGAFFMPVIHAGILTWFLIYYICLDL